MRGRAVDDGVLSDIGSATQASGNLLVSVGIDFTSTNVMVVSPNNGYVGSGTTALSYPLGVVSAQNVTQRNADLEARVAALEAAMQQ